MPGQRSKDIADFVTPRASYRSNLTAIDGVTAQSDTIDAINTALPPNTSVGLGVGGDSNIYGRNAQIDFALIVEGFSSISVELWLKATVDQAELVDGEDESSSEADVLPATEEWVFVDTKTATKSLMWVVKDIPPGLYKVLFTAKTGTGNLTIREQHAA